MSPAAAAGAGALLPHAAAAAAGIVAGRPAANCRAAQPGADPAPELQHFQAPACGQEPVYLNRDESAGSQQEGSLLVTADGESHDAAASPPLSPDATQLYDSHCPVEVCRTCSFSLGLKLPCITCIWQRGMLWAASAGLDPC